MTKAVLLIAALMLPATALAQDAPPPDKSAYTLFNPVPDDLLRSFSTDRPAKSNTPVTVDAGHFQYESDIVNWTYDRYNTAHTTNSNLSITDAVVKAGLTQNNDFELALAPINTNHATDRTADTHNAAFGFGDVYMRIKHNFFGNEGGTYALAVVPYVKAPSADWHLGNGHWEGGGYAPLSIVFSDTWTMTLQTELDILENADLTGVHPNYQNLVNVQHNFTETFAMQYEFWSDVNTDTGAQTQYTLDIAGLWTVAPNVQLDAGTNIGLNKAAPDIQLYFGLSQRF